MIDDTRGEAYAKRLEDYQGARWKQLLDVQRPYRWNIRRMRLGRTLDVGCGIGRNLASLDRGSLGVDHNARSVEVARSRGFDAITSEEFDARFPAAPDAPEFESLLLAHVLEHMPLDDAVALLAHYLPHARRHVVVICPQERGYASDSTHVNFLDAGDIEAILRGAGLRLRKSYSFPFPRVLGRWFTYNETVVLAERP